MWDVDEPSTRMCLQAVLKGADVAAHLSPVVGVFGDPSHLDRLCGAAKNLRRWWRVEGREVAIAVPETQDVDVIVGLFMVVPTLNDGGF